MGGSEQPWQQPEHRSLLMQHFPCGCQSRRACVPYCRDAAEAWGTRAGAGGERGARTRHPSVLQPRWERLGLARGCAAGFWSRAGCPNSWCSACTKSLSPGGPAPRDCKCRSVLGLWSAWGAAVDGAVAIRWGIFSI